MDIQTQVWQSPIAQTVPIAITAAATTAIFTPDAGKRFACHYMALQFAVATAGTFQFLSGSTPISGPFIYDMAPSTKGEVGVTLCCAGMPIFLGRANGDVFNLTTTNTYTINGFAVMTQIGGTDA